MRHASAGLFLAMLMLVLQAAPGAFAQAPETYVMQHGDTLWDLSVSHYGDPSMWRDLKSINGIPDVRAIADGTKIILPTRDQLLAYHNAATQAEKDTIRQQVMSGGGGTTKGSPSAGPRPSGTGPTSDPLQGLSEPEVVSKKGG